MKTVIIMGDLSSHSRSLQPMTIKLIWPFTAPLLLLSIVTSWQLSGAPSAQVQASPMFKIGTNEHGYYNEAEIVSSPHPEIPAELHEQCFKSCCIARFIIKQDGQSSVKLLSSSGSAEVDDIAITTLQHWKFKPATLDGKPVESARKIKVEFEVE